MSQELIAILIGGAIGVITSLVGGIMTYVVYIRRRKDSAGPIVYIFAVTGTLVLMGVVAIILSLIVGELDLALLTGLGVFVGFSLAFGVLLFVMSRRTSTI